MSTQICAAVAFKNNVNRSIRGCGSVERRGVGLGIYGTAEVFEYPHCKNGRIVADVVRIDKGHTEGLEPHVTEQLIKLMLSAKK